MLVHPKTTGIIACCGSECRGGYISRVVAARIVNELRATQVVTISLPRLLIGTTNEKEFSIKHPTITLDGCAKACARKAVEKYCFKPIIGINVGDIIGEKEALASVSVHEAPTHRHASEIEKVSGIVMHMMDTLAVMYEKANAAWKNSCDHGTCDCGCDSSSCGCGCGCSSEDAPAGDQPITKEPNMEGIVIYTKTGCPFCAKVLQEYREKGVGFQEVNTSVHPWAKQMCNDRYGAEKVPVIVKDGVAIQIGDVDGKG